MTYYITRGRTILCLHLDETRRDFVYANTEKGTIDLPFEWAPIVYDNAESAQGLARHIPGARVLSRDALLGGASYCAHTRDLFAGVQP